jgi:hypothetical protein
MSMYQEANCLKFSIFILPKYGLNKTIFMNNIENNSFLWNENILDIYLVKISGFSFTCSVGFLLILILSCRKVENLFGKGR